MAAEHPVDISNVPELVRLAEDVRTTRQPRVLRRANEDLAVLAPLPASQRRAPIRSRRSTTAALAVVERTAGIFRGAAKQPPATIEDETGAFEQAVADQVMQRAGS